MANSKLNSTVTTPKVAKAKVLHFTKIEDGKLFYTVNAGKTAWWRKIEEDQKEVRHYKHVYGINAKAETLTLLRPFEDEATTVTVSAAPTTKSGKPNLAASQESDFEARVEAGLSNRIDGVDYQAKMVDGVMKKICLCCNDTKEVTLFSNLSRAKDGKINNCKDCEKRRKAK